MNSKKLLDWLYPRRCAFCDEVLGNMEKYLCHSCQRRMPKPIGEPNCKKCGKPLLREEQEYCYDCNRQEPSFTRAKGLFLYEDPLKESLMGLKFRERKEYGIFLGRLMGLYGADFIRQVHPQVIFPVPIHRKKKSVRGYNQAEVFARELSKKTDIPVENELVVRVENTPALKLLNYVERKNALDGAFQVRKNIVNCYKSILLVDDIYTTGSTAEEISRMLKQSGNIHVYLLCICIGKQD